MSSGGAASGADAPVTGGTTPVAGDPAPGGRVFRVLLVPGVNPDRWLRVWRERLPDVPLELVQTTPAAAAEQLRAGDADVALLRTPADRTGLDVIPLYEEVSVVVVPRDHVLTVVDEAAPADLADETLVVPDDDLLRWSDAPGSPFAGGAVATTADAFDLVAAGVGVVVLPMSVARLHHRRGLASRPVPEAPRSGVGLAWAEHDELVEEFIGIVRGRTAGSSRGRGAQAAAPDARAARSGGKAAPAATGKGAGGGSGGKGSGKGAGKGSGTGAGKGSGTGSGRTGKGGGRNGGKSSGKSSGKGARGPRRGAR